MDGLSCSGKVDVEAFKLFYSEHCGNVNSDQQLQIDGIGIETVLRKNWN